MERFMPVLQDVLKNELRDLRGLKPLQDSFASRLDAASQENAAQFETLREIVKRLSTSLRDKADVAEVTALVEQHCGDRIEALEASCNELFERVSRFEQWSLVREGCCLANTGETPTTPKDIDNVGGLAMALQPIKAEAVEGGFDELMCSSTSLVKRFSIDTVRGDPPCKDPPKQGKSELDLLRYECELEQLRSMVLEGQSAIEQLRTALVRERDTGVAERARLDGLQKSLADNVVTLSRTHGSVGERLQHMQQMLDDLKDSKLEKLNSSTEAILGDATTEALRHHHNCLEALRHRLEKTESFLRDRQDSMENMVSEENRRIWLAMERHLDSGRTNEPTAGASLELLDSGRQQQAGNIRGTAAIVALSLPPADVPVASSTSSSTVVPSTPVPPSRTFDTSGTLVPCSRSCTPTQRTGHYGASSTVQAASCGGTSVSLSTPQAAPPWHGSSVQTPPPLPPANRSPARGGGSGTSPPAKTRAISDEATHMPTNGCSGAVTPVHCTSFSPVVTPTHGVATPTRNGSPPPQCDPSRTPTPVRVGSPIRSETPVRVSLPPTGSRIPSGKQTPGRPVSGSTMSPPGALNHRSPGGSPVTAHRQTVGRNRGGTPSNAAAAHRRGCLQERASRTSGSYEFGAVPRVRGQ